MKKGILTIVLSAVSLIVSIYLLLYFALTLYTLLDTLLDTLKYFPQLEYSSYYPMIAVSIFNITCQTLCIVTFSLVCYFNIKQLIKQKVAYKYSKNIYEQDHIDSCYKAYLQIIKEERTQKSDAKKQAKLGKLKEKLNKLESGE